MGVAFLLRLTVQAELEAGTLVEVPVRGLKVEHKVRLRYPGRSHLWHAARAFLLVVRQRSA